MTWADIFRLVWKMPVIYRYQASYEFREWGFVLMLSWLMNRIVSARRDVYWDLSVTNSHMWNAEIRSNSRFYQYAKMTGFYQYVENSVSVGMGGLVWGIMIVLAAFGVPEPIRTKIREVLESE